MTLIIDHRQDRLIDELYAWVCEDPATHLEGICAVSLFGREMQAVTSSRETALKLRKFVIEIKGDSGKRFRLVRFTKADVVEEL